MESVISTNTWPTTATTIPTVPTQRVLSTAPVLLVTAEMESRVVVSESLNWKQKKRWLSTKIDCDSLVFSLRDIQCLCLSLDIDECGTNTDNCHVDANCTNTKGSFYCTCKTGYSGNGIVCEGRKFYLLFV